MVTAMLSWRRAPGGEWVVYGPVDEVVPGTVEVPRRDGTVAEVVIQEVTHPVRHDGEWRRFGKLHGNEHDRSARSGLAEDHHLRDPFAPRWRGGRVFAPVAVLEQGVVDLAGERVRIGLVTNRVTRDGVRMGYGVPLDERDGAVPVRTGR